MAEYGMCGTCGTRQELEDNGKVKKHDGRLATARGYIKAKCPGSGRSPMPRG